MGNQVNVMKTGSSRSHGKIVHTVDLLIETQGWKRRLDLGTQLQFVGLECLANTLHILCPFSYIRCIVCSESAGKDRRLQR